LELVTRELIQEAFGIALPTIRKLCEKYTWGPKGVVIAVACRSSSLIRKPPYALCIMEELGPKEGWQDDFLRIVLQKLGVSSRTGRTSHDVITNKPWLLTGGDSLYRGAVAEDEGLAVAVSGSYPEIDEAAAWIVFNLIAALCHMRIRQLRETKVNVL